MTTATTGAPASKPTREKRARAPSGGGGKVVPDQPLWNQATRIGGGITPARIGTILRSADSGDMRQLMDLSNECRQRDPHLQAVLATHEESIAGLQWQLSPPEGARAKDKRAAKWAEAVLKDSPHMGSLIAHLAGAVFYSYAVSEIAWTKDDGKLIPDAFHMLSARRFGFRLSDGMFVWRDDGMSSDGVDFVSQHPRKFIVSQPRVTGDVPNREGLCRTLIWMSVFRNWLLSDWLRTAEVSWKPWRIGSYKKNGTNNEDRADLETVMRRLTTDGAVVIPDSSKIEVMWPGGSASTKATHNEFVTLLANEMSKATLGQTETTQSSSSSGYAQAKVHDAVRRDLLEARAKHVANVLTRDLIQPLIDLNFDGVRAPRFEFVTKDTTDLLSFSTAVKNLRDAGCAVPQAWVWDECGIPAPKEGDALLGEDDGEDEEPNEEPGGKPDETPPPEGEEPPEDEKPAAGDGES